jgi:hypothetical protein
MGLDQRLRQACPAGLCPGSPDIVQLDQTLSGWRSRANMRAMNFLRFDLNFADAN